MTKNLAPAPPSKDEIITLVQRELGVEVLSLQALRSGAWSSATAVTIHNAELILRFSKTPDDFRCDELAASYSSPGLPIPRVHGIDPMDERWWCLSDRMPGAHLDDLTNSEMERALPSIAAMLIAMRNVDTTTTTGFGGWDEHGNGIFDSFADQLMDVENDVPHERGGDWSTILNQHAYESKVFSQGLLVLERLCRYLPPDRHLIHQDTLNYNVVAVDGRISGIFDWGCAMWGDAIYDLAWFRFWDPWYPQWASLDVPGYLEQHVRVLGDNPKERMQCCLIHIGLAHIRYNAFTGNLESMREVAVATERLL